MKRQLHWIMRIGLLTLFMSIPSQLATAGDRGALRGRMIYDGKAPPQKRLDITTNKAFCEKFHPVDESLIVAKEGGLANVVVWIRPKRGRKLALPTGTYEFQFWHERVGYLKEARFEGGATDRRGRVKMVIHNGVKDLGAIRVRSALLDHK